MSQELPRSLARIFEMSQVPEVLFSELMPALGRFLDCDRCFLYLRNPETAVGRVEFCWVRDATIPEIYDKEWKKESKFLASQDPMFAAALSAKPSIFVEDIRTTSPEILNREFEEKNFGHRALIHAHLCQQGQLWGVLQLCSFKNPKTWTEVDRQAIKRVVLAITPIAVGYVTSVM
ncbi:GAF domain-containing protein [Altericista sp. CCNU0014]|uniref:GAF domain-containing protein n=1 Tax=Altericista sp. CCNU0014 TaxID=3082949 RepID=UPI00384C13C1